MSWYADPMANPAESAQDRPVEVARAAPSAQAGAAEPPATMRAGVMEGICAEGLTIREALRRSEAMGVVRLATAGAAGREKELARTPEELEAMTLDVVAKAPELGGAGDGRHYAVGRDGNVYNATTWKPVFVVAERKLGKGDGVSNKTDLATAMLPDPAAPAAQPASSPPQGPDSLLHRVGHFFANQEGRRAERGMTVGWGGGLPETAEDTRPLREDLAATSNRTASAFYDWQDPESVREKGKDPSSAVWTAAVLASLSEQAVGLAMAVPRTVLNPAQPIVDLLKLNAAAVEAGKVLADPVRSEDEKILAGATIVSALGADLAAGVGVRQIGAGLEAHLPAWEVPQAVSTPVVTGNPTARVEAAAPVETPNAPEPAAAEAPATPSKTAVGPAEARPTAANAEPVVRSTPGPGVEEPFPQYDEPVRVAAATRPRARPQRGPTPSAREPATATDEVVKFLQRITREDAQSPALTPTIERLAGNFPAKGLRKAVADGLELVVREGGVRAAKAMADDLSIAKEMGRVPETVQLWRDLLKNRKLENQWNRHQQALRGRIDGTSEAAGAQGAGHSTPSAKVETEAAAVQHARQRAPADAWKLTDGEVKAAAKDPARIARMTVEERAVFSERLGDRMRDPQRSGRSDLQAAEHTLVQRLKMEKIRELRLANAMAAELPLGEGARPLEVVSAQPYRVAKTLEYTGEVIENELRGGGHVRVGRQVSFETPEGARVTAPYVVRAGEHAYRLVENVVLSKTALEDLAKVDPKTLLSPEKQRIYGEVMGRKPPTLIPRGTAARSMGLEEGVPVEIEGIDLYVQAKNGLAHLRVAGGAPSALAVPTAPPAEPERGPENRPEQAPGAGGGPLSPSLAEPATAVVRFLRGLGANELRNPAELDGTISDLAAQFPAGSEQAVADVLRAAVRQNGPSGLAELADDIATSVKLDRVPETIVLWQRLSSDITLVERQMRYQADLELRLLGTRSAGNDARIDARLDAEANAVREARSTTLPWALTDGEVTALARDPAAIAELPAEQRAVVSARLQARLDSRRFTAEELERDPSLRETPEVAEATRKLARLLGRERMRELLRDESQHRSAVAEPPQPWRGPPEAGAYFGPATSTQVETLLVKVAFRVADVGEVARQEFGASIAEIAGEIRDPRLSAEMKEFLNAAVSKANSHQLREMAEDIGRSAQGDDLQECIAFWHAYVEDIESADPLGSGMAAEGSPLHRPSTSQLAKLLRDPAFRSRLPSGDVESLQGLLSRTAQDQLTLEGSGGLGRLAARVEHLFEGLPANGRAAAEHVALRLIQEYLHPRGRPGAPAGSSGRYGPN